MSTKASTAVIVAAIPLLAIGIFIGRSTAPSPQVEDAPGPQSVFVSSDTSANPLSIQQQQTLEAFSVLVSNYESNQGAGPQNRQLFDDYVADYQIECTVRSPSNRAFCQSFSQRLRAYLDVRTDQRIAARNAAVHARFAIED